MFVMTEDGRHMDRREIDKVERRLAEVLDEKRRETMGYVVLTVLLTPFFVALAALIVIGIAGYIFIRVRVAFDLDAATFFTTVSAFLAYVVVFVLVHSGPR